MISEWWLIEKELIGSGRGLILSYYPGIRLEGLRKITKNLNHDRRSPGPRIEPGTSRIRSRSISHSTTTLGKNRRIRRKTHCHFVHHISTWSDQDENPGLGGYRAAFVI
jgi:hypothetical protein